LQSPLSDPDPHGGGVLSQHDLPADDAVVELTRDLDVTHRQEVRHDKPLLRGGEAVRHGCSSNNRPIVCRLHLKTGQ
jgi:hypothetical protein